MTTVTEPAWHRRLRNKRSNARTLVRLAKAEHLLASHHSAQQMAPRKAWGHGNGRPYTMCPQGCRRSWRYDHKITESCVCQQCGAAFQAAWELADGPKARCEWSSQSDAAKAAAIKLQYDKAKLEGVTQVVLALESLHPEITQAKGKVLTPYLAFQEATQKNMAAKRKLELALDKATNLSIQLEKAQADAAKALSESVAAERILEDASAKHNRASGLDEGGDTQRGLLGQEAMRVPAHLEANPEFKAKLLEFEAIRDQINLVLAAEAVKQKRGPVCPEPGLPAKKTRTEVDGRPEEEAKADVAMDALVVGVDALGQLAASSREQLGAEADAGANAEQDKFKREREEQIRVAKAAVEATKTP